MQTFWYAESYGRSVMLTDTVDALDCEAIKVKQFKRATDAELDDLAVELTKLGYAVEIDTDKGYRAYDI